MNKLFYYEWKRMIRSRFFLALLLITGMYGCYMLRSEMLLGVGGAAPYSGWSVGACFAQVLPIILLAQLLFLSHLFSRQEQAVAQLRRATAYSPLQYGLLRCSIILLCSGLLSLMVLLLQVAFCQRYFHAGTVGEFLPSICFSLVPAAILLLGVGLLVGELHRNALYILMLAVLVSNGLVGLTGWDLSGLQYFSTGVLQVPVDLNGEPLYFFLPVAVRQRWTYLVVGLLLATVGLWNHFLFAAGETQLYRRCPVKRKQAIAAMVLLLAALLWLPVPVFVEQTAVASNTGDGQSIEFTEAETFIDTQAPIAIAQETVETDCQIAMPLWQSLVSNFATQESWQKRWQQYQQWGLQEMNNGTAFYHGKPVAQILDCDGSYVSYRDDNGNGCSLYIQRNFWGKLDAVLEIDAAQIARILQAM